MRHVLYHRATAALNHTAASLTSPLTRRVQSPFQIPPTHDGDSRRRGRATRRRSAASGLRWREQSSSAEKQDVEKSSLVRVKSMLRSLLVDSFRPSYLTVGLHCKVTWGYRPVKVAQLGERLLPTPKVRGSDPYSNTMEQFCASWNLKKTK